MRKTQVVCALLLSLPSTAAAELIVAGEFAGTMASSSESGVAGPGAGVRAGWSFDLPFRLRVEPEVAVLRNWELRPTGCDGTGGCPSVTLTRFAAGARLSLDTPVAPGIYGRASLASAHAEGGDARTGTTTEAGVFVDLRLVSRVEAGVHAAYGIPSFEGDVLEDKYLLAGLHLAVLL